MQAIRQRLSSCTICNNALVFANGQQQRKAGRYQRVLRLKDDKNERKRVEAILGIVKDDGDDPIFRAGDSVTISTRFPVGHYRVPLYIRGKKALMEDVLTPRAIDNEDESFGRNAGFKRRYYRVSIPLTELWIEYAGSPSDALRIEVYENWLERSN